MSYVDLKHLLADLALEAVRDPEQASWIAAAVACAELASAEQPRIVRRECLRRAAVLAAPFGWSPSEADVTRLVRAGLFSAREDLIVLPEGFVPHLAYFKQQSARTLKALADLRGTDTAQSPEAKAVRTGAALFNAGLFFECHEWFEGVWKATRGEARDFYHGIVQVAAAFYHYEKRNLHGGRTLLGKGLARLAGYPARYLGVELDRLRRDLERWAAHFEGDPRPADYPRITLH